MIGFKKRDYRDDIKSTIQKRKNIDKLHFI